MSEVKVRPGLYATLAVVLAAIVGWFLPDLLPAWWLWLPAALLVGIAFGNASYRFDRRRQRARAQDVAALERAEAWLIATDDEPPPLPPAIPMEMRDLAFQRREARLDLLSETINASRSCVRGTRSTDAHWRRSIGIERRAEEERDELLAQPLIAGRSFTLLTHCQHGHVATHWLGRITTDHVERICRFERCGAVWLERT